MQKYYIFLGNHWEFFAGLIIGALGLNIYSFYCREKDQLIKDIEKIVDDCTSLPSFNERSEYKLSSWQELGNGELHRKSVSSLRRIRKEMIRYFNIHIEMDLE